MSLLLGMSSLGDAVSYQNIIVAAYAHDHLKRWMGAVKIHQDAARSFNCLCSWVLWWKRAGASHQDTCISTQVNAFLNFGRCLLAVLHPFLLSDMVLCAIELPHSLVMCQVGPPAYISFVFQERVAKKRRLVQIELKLVDSYSVT